MDSKPEVPNENLIKLCLISFLIVLLTWYVTKFYLKVMKMPPGPFPLPVLGNIFVYLLNKEYIMTTLSKLANIHGEIYCVWLGTKPVIFINDVELIKKVFNEESMNFNGRGVDVLNSVILPGKNNGILLADPSPKFTKLRKICHNAIRKFIANERLPILTADIVDYYVDSHKRSINTNVEFNPANLIDDINLRIISSLTLGVLKSKDFSEHSQIIACYKTIGKNVDQLGFAYYVPILLLFKYKNYIECKTSFAKIKKIIAKSFERHCIEFENNKIDDFCDALLFQRNDMLEKEKFTMNGINDEDFHMLLYDLFIAGMETNRHNMRWIFLFMSYYPEMQIQMRKEIMNNIGNRMPLLDDKINCDFTNAFIYEILRFRNVVPIGVPHKAMKDTKIGKYDIPKDAMVISFIYHYMFDKKYWKNPEEFNPGRFLKNGKLNMQAFPHFQPFGIGKRSCIGDRFSLNMIFLILARVFQNTPGQLFAFPNGTEQVDLQPNNKIIMQSVKRFNLVLRNQNDVFN